MIFFNKKKYFHLFSEKIKYKNRPLESLQSPKARHTHPMAITDPMNYCRDSRAGTRNLDAKIFNLKG